jgi:hypothetical protein
MAKALTDRETFTALLDGEKIEKVRQEGSGNYIYLKEDDLVDQNDNPANIYKMNASDCFQLYKGDKDE